MPNELENSIRSAMAKIAGYIEDAATMTVETRYVTTAAGDAANFDAAKPAALTVIKLDGDNKTVVPVREVATGQIEIDSALWDVHRENVTAATEYRARILSALLGAIQSRIK